MPKSNKNASPKTKAKENKDSSFGSKKAAKRIIESYLGEAVMGNVQNSLKKSSSSSKKQSGMKIIKGANGPEWLLFPLQDQATDGEDLRVVNINEMIEKGLEGGKSKQANKVVGKEKVSKKKEVAKKKKNVTRNVILPNELHLKSDKIEKQRKVVEESLTRIPVRMVFTDHISYLIKNFYNSRLDKSRELPVSTCIKITKFLFSYFGDSLKERPQLHRISATLN